MILDYLKAAEKSHVSKLANLMFIVSYSCY